MEIKGDTSIHITTFADIKNGDVFAEIRDVTTTPENHPPIYMKCQNDRGVNLRTGHIYSFDDDISVKKLKTELVIKLDSLPENTTDENMIIPFGTKVIMRGYEGEIKKCYCGDYDKYTKTYDVYTLWKWNEAKASDMEICEWQLD